ncbi:MAG TPA: protein kinase [Kofleriaceae bacterium]|jgi:hypothetical protein
MTVTGEEQKPCVDYGDVDSGLAGDSAVGDSLLRAIVATPSDTETTAALELGALVDAQYRIIRPLGRGGMGLVYLAHDERLGRDVAIKIGRAATPEVLKRLAQEARALARLSHPNVVTIYQIGAIDGCPYIAMEYVAGGTVREWLAAKPRSRREIVALYVAAGDGLAAAHAAGLVHRDFKPDNVLVGTDGRPRVADFGVVGGLGRAPEDLGGNKALTGIVGTPAYMAPEQFEGAAVDARADQFAWCASAWEALFDERPFKDSSARELSLDSGAHSASGRSIPRALEAALRRGLAHDRDARWPTIAALLEAVRRRHPISRARVALTSLVVVGAGAGLAAHSTCRASSAAVASPCPASTGSDVYVASGAGSGGNGTLACPFRTISDALASSPHEHATIHVAAGRYDRDHGERFPLVVRGDVAIVGAGRDVTRVVGAGPVMWPYGPLRSVSAAFEIGDARGRVELRALAIEGETAAPEYGRFGIVCDRGNLVEFTPADPPPANTRLAGLTVGPGFDQAIVVTAKHDAEHDGCNLALVGSIVRGSYGGLWTTGCSDRGDLVPVRAEVGDDTETGRNVFEGIRNPGARASAINVWDCTRDIVIRRNTLVDGDSGLMITRHPPGPMTPVIAHVVVAHNRFQGMTWVGVGLFDVARIDELDGNSFFANIGSALRSTALLLDPAEQEPPLYPSIGRARHNTFARNDVGLELRGRLLQGAAPIDFGHPGDPGDNTFACNSTERATSPGFDVLLGPTVRTDRPLPFVGNRWDHVPPTIGHDSVNGTDIETSQPAGLDTSGGSDVDYTCPRNR